MRIAFVGKGGSGKTTVAALFARHLAAQGKTVLAIDADINQHLARTLGMPPEDAAAIPPLGNNLPFIKDYLRGTNPRIASAKLMAKTTPPGTGSRLLRIGEENPVWSRLTRTHGGVRIMATGPFAENDLGVSCYHAKTGAVELLLNHLRDGKEEYVVLDMTAGADSFASGLFAAFDLTAVVVEPTWKSAGVLAQYRQYSHGFGVALAAVGNKITSVADKDFVVRESAGAPAVFISDSAHVRAAERGTALPATDLEPENAERLATLVNILDAREKDWKTYIARTHFFHRKNAESWANAAYGTDLTTQIDPSFEL